MSTPSTNSVARNWVICLTSSLALLAWNYPAALGDEAFRDDFSDVKAWSARGEWLTPHAENPVMKADAGVGKFEVMAPSKGMKWSRSLDDPVELEISPWLVIRYQATNFDLTKPDYVVWIEDGGKDHGGVNVLKGDSIRADGQWHTLTTNLLDAGVISPVTGIALQCFANERGNSALWVDYIAITDLPPAGAEGVPPTRQPASLHVVAMHEPAQWTAQPSWLGNYTPHHDHTTTPHGLKFSVQEGMMGTKWSRNLEEPIAGTGWVAMRYRARNLRGWGDYVLYANTGGATPQEQYLIREGELASDGDWHVAVAPVTLNEIRTLAIQVQALQNHALLEVADLSFSDQKPIIKLVDTLESTPGWPASTDAWRIVELPPGNLAGSDLARRLGAEGWLGEGPLTTSGVPFQVRGGKNAVLMTPLREPGTIRVELSGKANEAYLLLAAQFPQHDEPSYAGTSGQVRHVHRLVAQISYEDGTSEEQFPFSVNAGQHAVSPWVHTYALALDPTKTLRQLALVDGMNRGAFGLVALTLSDKPGPATAATQLRPVPLLPPEKPAAAQKIGIDQIGIDREGDVLTVRCATVSMVMNLNRGLRVTDVANLSVAGLETNIAPGPLFRVLGDGFEASSEEFEVRRVTTEQTDQGAATRIDLQCDRFPPAMQVSIWLDVSDPREIGMRGSIDLGGHDAVKTSIVFPELRDITFGGPPADCWIWCPRRGDVITATAVSLREPYAGAGNPLQVIGTFDVDRRTGLYMMTQDMDAQSKFYQVQKTGNGGRLAIEYTPLHDTDLPRTVVGCCQGDWHAQLARYRQWVATWYQSAAPRKSWFRQVWNFRQQFMHFALPTKSGIFDEAGKNIKLKEVVDTDAEAFGGVDYLHLFDWGWDPVHGRCGDYQPWDYLGGVENFRHAVAEVTAQQIPVGLYIEGILVDPQSELGKAHGTAWQMLGPGGKPYEYFAPSYHVCPRVGAWQEYLSDTYQRVRQQTGAMGFYIDEYGFSGPTYWCYNPDHGHPVPVTPVLGEREMLKQVRQKLGSEPAIYTEESPTDVNSQYQDGSFTYNISSVPDEWSPSHVNLYRFVFPHFKTIEIICCDQPLGTNVEAVKRCLFNGEAIWIEGIWDKWFAPEVRAQISLNRRIMRDNQECFASDYAQPLIPTLLSGLYANRFDQRADLSGKTCWTIYNTNYRTVRAEAIAVDHVEGAQYQDEMTGKPLPPRVADGTAHLTLEIAPRDVAVISRDIQVE